MDGVADCLGRTASSSSSCLLPAGPLCHPHRLCVADSTLPLLQLAPKRLCTVSDGHTCASPTYKTGMHATPKCCMEQVTWTMHIRCLVLQLHNMYSVSIGLHPVQANADTVHIMQLQDKASDMHGPKPEKIEFHIQSLPASVC